uniref:Protein kinase domain-containing protein n=1 Tax=Eutreptiella gymnastica TaxID=73025 RepID=A0A7S4C7D0_9EUGL
MSETGAVVGTAHYMAPELLKGGQATVGADIWAFGITCLQLLTGQLWMDATNVFAVLYALGTMEEAPEIPEDLPEEVQEFLRACLSIKPDERATALGLLNMPFLL